MRRTFITSIRQLKSPAIIKAGFRVRQTFCSQITALSQPFAGELWQISGGFGFVRHNKADAGKQSAQKAPNVTNPHAPRQQKDKQIQAFTLPRKPSPGRSQSGIRKSLSKRRTRKSSDDPTRFQATHVAVRHDPRAAAIMVPALVRRYGKTTISPATRPPDDKMQTRLAQDA